MVAPQPLIQEAHRAIMRASIPPCLALVRGVASRAGLVESVEQLKFATRLLEEVIGRPEV